MLFAGAKVQQKSGKWKVKSEKLLISASFFAFSCTKYTRLSIFNKEKLHK